MTANLPTLVADIRTSPRPWSVSRSSRTDDKYAGIVDRDGHEVAPIDGLWIEDAALIVAAVNALPGLLDELEALRRVAEAGLAIMVAAGPYCCLCGEALDHDLSVCQPGCLGYPQRVALAALDAATGKR